MMPMSVYLRALVVPALLLAASGVAMAMAPAVERVSHGSFRDVAVYRPHGPLSQAVMVLSGDAGWDAQLDADARALAAHGAFVAGIDMPQLRKALAGNGGCVFPDGDLENLSHYLQGYVQLPGYHPPLLIGQGSGAAVAYAMVSQAQAGVFAGALTVGFRPSLDLGRPPCQGKGTLFAEAPAQGAVTALLPVKQVPVPWVSLQPPPRAGQPAFDDKAFTRAVHGAASVQLADATPARQQAVLLAATDALGRNPVVRATPPAPKDLAGLPLIEVPAVAGTHSDTYAVLLSGDGGWAGLDKEVAGALAARGVPVVGFDSLRYFWKKRTPEELAGDLDRLLRYYGKQWGKSRVVLVGYSQGADVLPFALNRLAADTRGSVAQSVLLGLSSNAAFEFHLTNWMSDDVADGKPTLPEIDRLKAEQVVCVAGDGDDDSVCNKVPAGHMRTVTLPGGHHFDGDYGAVAQAVLAALPPEQAAQP